MNRNRSTTAPESSARPAPVGCFPHGATRSRLTTMHGRPSFVDAPPVPLIIFFRSTSIINASCRASIPQSDFMCDALQSGLGFAKLRQPVQREPRLAKVEPRRRLRATVRSFGLRCVGRSGACDGALGRVAPVRRAPLIQASLAGRDSPLDHARRGRRCRSSNSGGRRRIHRMKAAMSGCSRNRSGVAKSRASSSSLSTVCSLRWQMRCIRTVRRPPFDFGTRWC